MQQQSHLQKKQQPPESQQEQPQPQSLSAASYSVCNADAGPLLPEASAASTSTLGRHKAQHHCHHQHKSVDSSSISSGGQGWLIDAKHSDGTTQHVLMESPCSSQYSIAVHVGIAVAVNAGKARLLPPT